MQGVLTLPVVHAHIPLSRPPSRPRFCSAVVATVCESGPQMDNPDPEIPPGGGARGTYAAQVREPTTYRATRSRTVRAECIPRQRCRMNHHGASAGTEQLPVSSQSRHVAAFLTSGAKEACCRPFGGGIPVSRHRQQLPTGPCPSGQVLCARPAGCLVGGFSPSITIGTAPRFMKRRWIRSGPTRVTIRAGEGRSAREAPASARPRNATRCCTGASSPRRSCRCASGSARRPRCRPARGSRASPPTD